MKVEKKYLFKNSHLIRLSITLLFGLFFTVLLKATPAILIDSTQLKAKDDFKSSNLLSLAKGEVVEIKDRKRGWYQVETQSRMIGWLTLLQVRFETEINTKGSSELSKLVSLRKGHSNITATTGVRGIGENEIKNAKADFVALHNAKQFKVNSADSIKFAKEIPLTPQKINYKENTK